MPIRNAIIHHIDKKPDGNPAMLHVARHPLTDSQALENLAHDLNVAYNAKPSKSWGLFQGESGAYPFSGWLAEFLDGTKDFGEFSELAAEHLKALLEESNLSTGGHLLISHYQQGLTDYLFVAVLQTTEAVAVNEHLEVVPCRHLDLSQLHMAARINLTEWRTNPKSRQYVSFLTAKGGRKRQDHFRDFIGCTEGVDSPSETRTLLKAFSDFVESEDLPEEQAREKTTTLIDYAISQAKIGEPMTLDALSELMDDLAPQAFADFIRNKDYGLSPEIPADKRTLNSFRRFTAKADGISISFAPHLLGSKVEFDQARDTLLIHGVPTQLKNQMSKVAAAPASAPAADATGYPGAADDPLYGEAVRYVTETSRASISAVQRKLKIGYNRAARFIEEMEMAGIVTPMNTNGGREVIKSTVRRQPA